MSPGESSSNAGVAPTAAKDAAWNRWLTLLVFASFIFFAGAVVLPLGIGATPSETTDSAGRPMGFNDPLSAEHYVIILQHFRPAELLKPQYAYEWLLLAMQAMGAGLLLHGPRVPRRLTRWFFAVQPVVFPLGLVFCWAPPWILISFFSEIQNREGFTDVPFILGVGLMAHSAWVLSSLVIVFALRGPGLGLPRVWRALVEASRVGGRTFVNALRQNGETDEKGRFQMALR